MSRPEAPDMHAEDGNDSVEENTSICTAPAWVNLPEHVAQQAREIARTSENPEKRVGDFLDSAVMLDITYYSDGDKMDIRDN